MADFIVGLHGSLHQSASLGVHDAAYCIADVASGKIKALVEAEKLSGIRHDGLVPTDALKPDLAAVGIDPSCRLEIASTHFTCFEENHPFVFPLYTEGAALLGKPLCYCDCYKTTALGTPLPNYVYLHELAHVFCAFMYRSAEHERFLGMVIEGSGSFAQNSLFLIDGKKATLLEYNMPLLSGNFFHQWLSRKVFDAPRKDYAKRSAAPGKIMALADYGDAQRYRDILVKAVSRFQSGEYMDYRKDFCPELDDAFLSWQDRIDLCASGQKLFEDLILCEAERIRRTYGALPLYYAGGCALSVKANSKLKQLFPALVIPPNCGDDGIALGAVAAHAFLSHQKRLSPLNLEDGLSSPSMSCWNIEGKLSREDVERVARWLSAGEVVAFAQGAPEAGPRALCKRSILASPASAGMKEIINHIKEREYYRPVAPIVLDSFGGELVENYFYSPFMLYSFIVKDQWRPRIPAALHVDGSARLQSIPDDNTDIAKLLRTYAKMSDSPPVLLNTSLNSRGKPIASLRKQIETEIKKLKIKYLVLGGEAIELS